MAKCNAIKPNGQPCQADAQPGADRCWSHSPDHAAERRRNASRGGKSAGRGRPWLRLAEIEDQQRTMLFDVLEGAIPPGVAAVATQIQNTRLRLVEIERRLKEQEELIERIEALEASVAERTQAVEVYSNGSTTGYKT
jgi:hypothetical protein